MAQPQPSLAKPPDADPPGEAAARPTSEAPPAPSLLGRSSRRKPVAPYSALPPFAPKQVVYRAASVSSARFIRAYSTTFVVIFSYLWLALRARFLGQQWKDQQIARVHKRNAQRVYNTILRLQGLFIKVGQLLSIMANFLPEEFRNELEGLQDQVPPRPYEEIAERIEKELGGRIDATFLDFNRVPIASASLGQVHTARLKTGERVCVKVQHRDIDDIVRLDLKAIRRIMGIVQWFVPLQGLDQYYHQIKELLHEELDFTSEANNIEDISKNFEKDPRVVFPKPVRSLSTSRVLTTFMIDGKKITDTAAIDAMGVDKKDVAKRLVRAYCQMIFMDGLYHADPHPGNIMIRSDGALILLDFGAVAELSPEMREGIPEFLEGVLRRDTQHLIKALKKMHFLSRTTDEEMSEKIIEYFHRRFQEEVKLESFNLKDIKIDPQRGFESLFDLRKMDIGLKELSGTFHIPKDWVLLERTLLLLYGCCSLLDPDLAPMAIIQPYLQDFVLGNRDWTKIALDSLREAALGAVTLPEDMRKYVNKAIKGQLEVRVRGLPEGARTVYTVGRQMIYAAIGIFAAYEGLESYRRGEVEIAKTCVGVTIGAAVLLVLSSIFARPKRGR